MTASQVKCIWSSLIPELNPLQHEHFVSLCEQTSALCAFSDNKAAPRRAVEEPVRASSLEVRAALSGVATALQVSGELVKYQIR